MAVWGIGYAGMMMKKDINMIASEIAHHQKKAVELEKITSKYLDITLEDAYLIQKEYIAKAIEAGDQSVGWKMGLTSLAKQRSVGVNQPIYGRLLKSMEMTGEILNLKGLIHPRVEPELAFLVKKELKGPNVQEQDVWEATGCIAPALEVIDSRYKDFSFSHMDVVADNASSARFILSGLSLPPGQYNWDEIDVVMKKNNRVVQEGRSSAVLGHPVQSIIKLVHMLAVSGLGIEPGSWVLTGGMTEAVQVENGDHLSIEFCGLDTMQVHVMP
jgi:2-oxo-3-hexenedioate decarboxylase